ncbi:Polyketide synthase PksJ [Variovorax paradoxus]|uniref:Polyketide synthase PksJ n=1 Tax=Variovorax paradoxus TaxID=34073 RepID=A0A679JEA6_VARPD|nr:Polyketide synthase PksJ [Variovorax paradoxus]
MSAAPHPPHPAVATALPVLELPLDRPRPAVPAPDLRRTERTIEPRLATALRTAGAQAGGDLFDGLLGAFVATLYRLTAQGFIVVGVASGTRALCLATHAQLSFDTLVAECHAAMRSAPPGPSSPASVRFDFDGDIGDSDEGDSFELALDLRTFHAGLVAEARYDAQLFDEASVQRWLEIFECVIRSVAQAPGLPIGRLEVLSAEAASVLAALQPPRTPLAGEPFAHAGFAAQAAHDPTRPAVQDGSRRCSYGELDALSNRLAHALRERGIGRGQRVGLCLERGIDMMVALLAVLKSGAAYVPLDPSFPQARLDYYAEDAAFSLLLTSSGVASAPRAWCVDAAARVFELDREAGWRTGPAHALPPGDQDAHPEDIAYVIYTSGSTGKPKGVCVPHRAVANLMQSMQQAPGIGPGDRLAAVTTLSFDMAVPEVLLPLAAGAEIVLVQRDVAMDGRLLRAMLDDERITVLQATPGMWQLLLEAGWQGRIGAGPGLRGWIGAEPVRARLALELLERCTELWNLYGPTETTVWSTAWAMQRDAVASRGVSIGRPIDNTGVWILDGELQPCPVGVPGEICIDGQGVTLGYLERDELTAERFVDVDILGTRTRVYRSGDRGRWRNDGLLEHMGRLDFQVKVRGYRIEPGEIEARCNEYAGVSRSVVVAREDHPGDVRLVAYLALAPGAAPDRRALAQHLRERLPSYMVPQHMVMLAALPTLPNGKVDRASLPPPHAVPLPSAAMPAASRPPPACRPDRRSAPLTPAQERIRKLEAEHPGRAFHNMPCAQRLVGELDTARFEAALRDSVRRQPALRTRIEADPHTGVALQSIAAHAELPLPLVDLRHLPADQREAELLDRMQELADRPIDIHRAPMAHAALFRLAEQDHAFVFVAHHLVWDDSSFDVLARELSATFGAGLHAGAQPLPPIGATHGDHAEWLAEWMEEPAFEEQLGFWRHRAAAAPVPAARTDLPRRAGRHGRGGAQRIGLGLAATQRLRGVARGMDATLGELAFGIYALTLGHATGAEAISIAHPVDGRQQPGARGVMGLFDNLPPASLKVDMRQSLPQFVQGVKEELRTLAAYQHAPFERFVAASPWKFSFRDASDGPHRLAGLPAQAMHLMQRGATEDIALRLVDRPHGLEGALVCNSAIYLHETGTLLRERYLELLQRAADRPEAALASIASAEGSASAAYLQQRLAGTGAKAVDTASVVGAMSMPASGTPTARSTPHLVQPGQARLAQVWADVIRIDVRDIRASDNFFELGGDSLLAQRAVQQTEMLLGYRVAPQRYLFETLGQIAASSLAAPLCTADPPCAPAPDVAGTAPSRGLLERTLGWRRRS